MYSALGNGFPFVERLAAWASCITVRAPEKHYPTNCIQIIYSIQRSNVPEAKDYFQKLVNHTKGLDPRRPMTAVMNLGYDEDNGDILIICLYHRSYI